MTVYEGFEPVIGLEVHAQLLTESKIFCACQTSFGAPPNSRTCPVCLGLPGALPVLNKKTVAYAVRMILAVGGEVRRSSSFARKNYFYPDLPKGYQISQYSRPVGSGGQVEYILSNGRKKACRINRIHLEEDAGKSLHPESGDPYTRLDFNRCGVPLLEIVTEPDIRSPEEAYAYLVKLKLILQHLEICSGDMEKGHLRCDANISVRPKGKKKLGSRTELKNLNSFRGVEKALDYEIRRQIKILKRGDEVERATLLWDENRQVALLMRTKEESEDYRYFREPDLPELVIENEWIEEIRQSLPEMPDAKIARFIEQYGIRRYDAELLTENRSLADYYENVMAHFDNGQTAANWMLTEILGLLSDAHEGIGTFKVSPRNTADLLNHVQNREISGRTAKEVFREMAQTGKSVSEIIERNGLKQITDEKKLRLEIEKVLEDNPEQLEQYRAGKTALFDYFIGQVMRRTGGRAEPETVNRLLKKILEGIKK
ncbi:MAG: Asp-tRNA(Asn)/Glu-tRNA(Gln) amidotransferase subunit GatB [candidate division Zixibacteria bacterium]|nr:Asp-tRNA(Asn)/Glu-tRNA(Gln) amidotransferase subunit GatB [candidate division Zixibacteria bacterium]